MVLMINETFTIVTVAVFIGETIDSSRRLNAASGVVVILG